MLFNEVYGVYYDVLSEILSQAVTQTLTNESMDAIIRERDSKRVSLQSRRT